MLDEKIKRINELARKAKTPEGLTEEEKQEQAKLRQEYIAEWRQGVTQVLDNTYVMDEQGNKRKLKKKWELMDNFVIKHWQNFFECYIITI